MVGVFCFCCVLCVWDFAVPPNKKCGILVAVQVAKIISTGVIVTPGLNIVIMFYIQIFNAAVGLEN